MTQYKVFPAIGIARVGNAPSKFYIGPEQYRGLPTRPDNQPFTEADFRDENGKLCRQAALFHVYKVENGVETEITLDSPEIASITWHAHLANKKSSWYQFQVSLGENGYASNHPLRNPHAVQRNQLIIDPGPRQIAGSSQGPVGFNRDNVPAGYTGAHFPPPNLQPLGDSIDTLGELRTDEEGRLLLLGGLGIAGSTDANPTITEYANNDNWWDDTSDGPVGATIVLTTGETIEALPARVLVGPPSYAPQIPNLVSLYDTIFDAMVRAGYNPNIFSGQMWKSGPHGYRPSFTTEIRPLLERAILYPWVAAIPPKPHKFNYDILGQMETIGGMRQGSLAGRGLRQYILDFLRPPGSENIIVNAPGDDNSGAKLQGGIGATMMPFLAGDNALTPGTLTSKYLRVTDTQYFFLQQWANGWFTDDPLPPTPGSNLTRFVLENCVGGAFSPGIEMGWISRDASIYSEPMRISANFVEHGPLQLDFHPQRMEPGDVTRYMAVPWQADFNECSSQPIDGRILWWWPAQRPEYVYLKPEPQALRAAGDIPAPPDLRSGKQVPWLGTDFDQKAGNYIQFTDDIDMVKYWDQLGFVMEQEVEGEQRFVEVSRTLPRTFTP